VRKKVAKKLSSKKMKIPALSEARMHVGLTVSQMARAMGVKPQVVDSLEATSDKVSLKNLLRYLNALKENNLDILLVLEAIGHDVGIAAEGGSSDLVGDENQEDV
jgi:transcriptional regulator with XRE-family HTH domain